MKITLNEKGFAIVTSETLNESIKLQEQFTGQHAKKMGRPIGSRNERKLERRKECPICGKPVKRSRTHMLQKHPADYKKKYGDTTSGGRTVDSLVGGSGWSRRMKVTSNLLD